MTPERLAAIAEFGNPCPKCGGMLAQDRSCAACATHSHVRPEPVEAPQPRVLTLNQHEARVKAWQAIAYTSGTIVSFELVSRAIDAYEESLAQAHRSALDRVR